MTMAQTLLAEFDHEAKTTRKFLQQIPDDKLGMAAVRQIDDGWPTGIAHRDGTGRCCPNRSAR